MKLMNDNTRVSCEDDNIQPFQKFFAACQQLLRKRLHYFLNDLQPTLRVDVEYALKEAGKLLFQTELDAGNTHSTLPSGAWSLLTLLVAQHVSPEVDLFVVESVAVAVECFICALDLLDDVEDEDQTPIMRDLGTARVLNVSTTLLMLAQRAILSLSRHEVSSILIISVLNTLQNAALEATAGQHLDLVAEQQPATDFTDEKCIEIAAGKAGALMSLACQLGAICAGADEETYKHFSELGKLLGIANQLDNDCHDLYYLLQDEGTLALDSNMQISRKSAKTDLLRKKKTLPVVIAARIEKVMQLSGDKQPQARQLAFNEGILATWGICLLYRERVRDSLQEIEARHPISPALRYLLGFE